MLEQFLLLNGKKARAGPLALWKGDFLFSRSFLGHRDEKPKREEETGGGREGEGAREGGREGEGERRKERNQPIFSRVSLPCFTAAA